MASLDLSKTPRQRSSRSLRSPLPDADNHGTDAREPSTPDISRKPPPKKTRSKSLVLMKGGEIAAAIAAKSPPPTGSRTKSPTAGRKSPTAGRSRPVSDRPHGAPPMTPGRRSIHNIGVTAGPGFLSPQGSSSRSIFASSNNRPASMRSLRGRASSEDEEGLPNEPTVIAPVLAPSPRDKHSVKPAAVARPEPQEEFRPLPGDERIKRDVDITATPAGRRKVRQQLRADYVSGMVGDDGQVIDPKDIVLDPAKWPKHLDLENDVSSPTATADSAEGDDDDDEETVDTLANFVNSRLLKPEKKKLHAMNLHEMGNSLKKNVAKPMKKYVSKKAGKGQFSSYED